MFPLGNHWLMTYILLKTESDADTTKKGQPNHVSDSEMLYQLMVS
jgi:hypothetical protein